MKKADYIIEIDELLASCQDLVLIDFILKLLQKTNN